MKILKRILIGIVVFIALLLIIALFIPTTYTVSESIVINKPKQQVYDYAKLVRNQEKYSVWILKDPNIDMSYTGTDGTVGFVSAWNSKDDGIGEDMGEGSQTITAMTDERIDMDIKFIRPFESQQKAAMLITSETPTTTKVTSEFYGSDPYPMNLMSFIGKSIIRDAEQQNLKNLKEILEKY